jgi:hypothetical protein
MQAPVLNPSKVVWTVTLKCEAPDCGALLQARPVPSPFLGAQDTDEVRRSAADGAVGLGHPMMGTLRPFLGTCNRCAACMCRKQEPS